MKTASSVDWNKKNACLLIVYILNKKVKETPYVDFGVLNVYYNMQMKVN